MNNIPDWRQSVYILPNLVTTASLATAFLAVLMAVEGRFETAAAAIFLSCLFDGLDGSVARLTRSESEFGVQYDSLADVVAFGVTPALTFHLWVLHGLGTHGVVAAVLFLTCGALRLARFNLQASKPKAASAHVRPGKHFTGLPIPAAGCTLASLMLFAPNLPMGGRHLAVMALALSYLLAGLMVSHVPYASLKDTSWFRAHPRRAVAGAVLLVTMVALWPQRCMFPLLLTYVASGPLYALVRPAWRRRAGFQAATTHDRAPAMARKPSPR